MVSHCMAQDIQAKLKDLSLLLILRIHQTIEQEYAYTSILYHSSHELRLP